MFFSTDNRQDALRYKYRRRKIEPALYNRNRLKERPLPAAQEKQSLIKVNTRPKQNQQQPKRPLNSVTTIVVNPTGSPPKSTDENELPINLDAVAEADVSTVFFFQPEEIST